MNHPSGTSIQGVDRPAVPGNTINRIFSLDVLRGIALLGILIVSIWQFGGFSPNQQTKLRLIHHGGNYNLFAFVSILFEGKMRALFSIIFGAGIILFFSRRSYPSSLSVVDLYIRKQMWLIAFGVFNAVVLLWQGDILFHYGIVGILVFAFWRMSPKGLLITALITTLIFCGKNLWDYHDDKKAYRKYLAVTDTEKKFSKDSLVRVKKDSIWASERQLAKMTVADTAYRQSSRDTVAGKTGAPLARKWQNDSLAKEAARDTLTSKQKKDKEVWVGAMKELQYDSAADAAHNKAMRGNYTQVWKHLLPDTQYREAMWLYRTGIWDIGSMMLLGMALFGFGFFGSGYSVKKYLLIAIPVLIAGFFLAWLRQESQYAKLTDYGKYIGKNMFSPTQFFPFERALLAIGYASLIMIFIRIRVLNWLWRAFADAGRMAFTNYLLQTIICTFFFYGYGLGNFGRLSQVELYFVIAEIWLVQVILSVFWFRYHTIGPLEWVWRRLIYGKWFPIKKAAAATIHTGETTTN